MLTFAQIIVVMLLMHFLADYTLQGWLANGKQKSWWEKEVPKVCDKPLDETKYRWDYVMALFCHSLYWSILVCIPFFFSSLFVPAVAVNTLVHMYVDDLKANKLKINLIQDQACHFAQILITAFCLV